MIYRGWVRDGMSRDKRVNALQHWRRTLFALFIAVLLFRGKMIYVAFYVVLAIYLFARYALPKGFTSLAVTRHVQNLRLFVGETTQITLRVRNASWIPMVWVEIHDELPPALSAGEQRRAIVSVGPLGQAEWSYTLSGKVRGVHRVGPAALEAGDPFGLETQSGSTSLQHDVIVYPKIRPLVELGLPSRLPVGQIRTHTKIFEDPARVMGVREYQPGDPLKRIHWKLSSKHSRFYVKEYQPTITLDTAILLNLNVAEYEPQLRDFRAELGIETAASIAYYLHEKRQSLSLVTNGRDPIAVRAARDAGDVGDQQPIVIPARKGIGSLTTVLELLAKIELAEGRRFVEAIDVAARTMSWGSTLIAVTPEDTDELVQALLHHKRNGFNVLLIVTGDVRHPAMLERGGQTGLVVHRVRSESEIDLLGKSYLATG